MSKPVRKPQAETVFDGSVIAVAVVAMVVDKLDLGLGIDSQLALAAGLVSVGNFLVRSITLSVRMRREEREAGR